MKDAGHVALAGIGSRVGWCCSYCSGPLSPRDHGLYCAAEGRWFATDRGVHRLLPEERRSELRPAVELYQRARRDEGWRAERGLPHVGPDHPRAALWRSRAARFESALELAAPLLGPGPWTVLDVGAGCCWAGARLLEGGHSVVAVDVNLDAQDGLLAAPLLLPDGAALPCAEAEMEALPLEPGTFDLVLAVDSLHHAPRPTRALVEMRRVTRRGGVLLVLESPVFRRRPDGEAAVTEAMVRHERRYGIAVPREFQPGYLVHGELPSLFGGTGWRLEVHGWPGAAREGLEDLVQLARWRRRGARFPVLLSRRDG